MLQTAAACDGQRDKDIVALLGRGEHAAAFELVRPLPVQVPSKNPPVVPARPVVARDATEL